LLRLEKNFEILFSTFRGNGRQVMQFQFVFVCVCVNINSKCTCFFSVADERTYSLLQAINFFISKCSNFTMNFDVGDRFRGEFFYEILQWDRCCLLKSFSSERRKLLSGEHKFCGNFMNESKLRFVIVKKSRQQGRVNKL
jgi:hypothetical protein